MSNKEPSDANSENISREWAAYMVKAKVSEAVATERGASWPKLRQSEIDDYNGNILKGYESHIVLWPTPVYVKSNDIVDIISFKENGKSVRIYPPFPVNEPSETSGAFEKVLVPEGVSQVQRAVELPSSAVRGVRMEHGPGEEFEWCRAFRLDVETGADGLPTLRLFLDHISQFTHQWWIRGTHNPMLGPRRMGGAISSDYKIVSELKYKGAGEIESSWYGAVQYQPNLGFGAPLDKGKWLLSAHHTQESRNPDQGLLAFYDGMADFMSGQDRKAILNLCISTEIVLSKHSLIVLRRPPYKLERSVRNTSLVDDATKKNLKNLVIDRNCVAHGREPIKVRDGEATIGGYIGAVRNLVSAYLGVLPQGEWPGAMDLSLDNEKIFRGP